MTITLQAVTRDNVFPVVEAKVAPGQEDFVAPNAVSLAQAYVEPGFMPLAILAGESVVGFAMYTQGENSGRWWLMRFMIAAEHQGKGHGAAALRAVVDLMAERHGCRQIFLSYVPANAAAERLYARTGFVPTGEIVGDEVVARLNVSDGP